MQDILAQKYPAAFILVEEWFFFSVSGRNHSLPQAGATSKRVSVRSAWDMGAWRWRGDCKHLVSSIEIVSGTFHLIEFFQNSALGRWLLLYYLPGKSDQIDV
jgi:hypothetical protein